jgi:hypothetical protein
MPVLDDRTRETLPVIRLVVLTLGTCVLGFAGLIHVEAQATAPRSHAVAVKSEPAGATIWKKDGRDYTCTNSLAPGKIELTFHGDSDVQRLRLRRFGYTGTNLDVKLTDQEISGVLSPSDYQSLSFQLADGATPNLILLNAAMKAEFEKTLLTDEEAFRCVPIDLYFIHLVPDKETSDAYLIVGLRLDRSFGGTALRLASHAGTAPERRQKMGQVVLESGIAEVLARFHRLAAKFPQVKVISVRCFFATTEAVLETETTRTPYSITTTTAIMKSDPYNGLYQWGTKITTTSGVNVNENTVINDQETEKTIEFIMPTAQIPDTLDKKAITDAVLATGKIITGNVRE